MRLLGLILLFQFTTLICYSQKVKGFRTKRQVEAKQTVLREIGQHILTNKTQILIIDSIQDKSLRKKLKFVKADVVTIGYHGFPHDKVTPVDSIVVTHRYHGTYRHNGKDTSWTETIIYDMTKQKSFFSSENVSGLTKISDRLYYSAYNQSGEKKR